MKSKLLITTTLIALLAGLSTVHANPNTAEGKHQPKPQMQHQDAKQEPMNKHNVKQGDNKQQAKQNKKPQKTKRDDKPSKLPKNTKIQKDERSAKHHP